MLYQNLILPTIGDKVARQVVMDNVFHIVGKSLREPTAQHLETLL